jgi:hypothetical protein
VDSPGRRASTELVYELLRTRNTILDAGAGVRISMSPSAFVRTRLLHARELAWSVIARLAVTPFWDAKDGFGESNQVDLERQIAAETLLRWSNFSTITERTVGWNWGTEHRRHRHRSDPAIGDGAELPPLRPVPPQLPPELAVFRAGAGRQPAEAAPWRLENRAGRDGPAGGELHRQGSRSEAAVTKRFLASRSVKSAAGTGLLKK